MTAFHRARIEPNRVYRPRCPHCGALGDRRFVVDQDGMLEDILSVGLRFDAVTTCSSCHFEGPMLPVPEGRRAAQTYASEADWRREVMSEARHALARAVDADAGAAAVVGALGEGAAARRDDLRAVGAERARRAQALAVVADAVARAARRARRSDAAVG